MSTRVFAGDLGPRHRRYGASGKRIGSKDAAAVFLCQAVSVWLWLLVRLSVIEALTQFWPVSFYSACTYVTNKHISSQPQTKGAQIWHIYLLSKEKKQYYRGKRHMVPYTQNNAIVLVWHTEEAGYCTFSLHAYLAA